MRLTVCELSDDPAAFREDWTRLIEHVQNHRSDLVLLPELPACPWFAYQADFDEQLWQQVMRIHEIFINELPALAPATVLGTRPHQIGAQRLNQAFVWNKQRGCQVARAKAYFPDEAGFYEAKWFDAPVRHFAPFVLNEIKLGFLICTELMFNEWARHYGRQGCQIIAVPRATEKTSVERWLIALRMAAIVSGAFVLSSNHFGIGPSGIHFGGAGAIISPEGEVLAVTSREQPFVTVEVDLAEAEAAKKTYPRYVVE
jgi:N-carbamoylputrescine amidase